MIPQPVPGTIAYKQLLAGAFNFTMTMGRDKQGLKVISRNGVYNGKGGPVWDSLSEQNSIAPPVAECGNFWAYFGDAEATKWSAEYPPVAKIMTKGGDTTGLDKAHGHDHRRLSEDTPSESETSGVGNWKYCKSTADPAGKNVQPYDRVYTMMPVGSKPMEHATLPAGDSTDPTATASWTATLALSDITDTMTARTFNDSLDSYNVGLTANLLKTWSDGIKKCGNTVRLISI
jgi:hypothetical protein